MRGYSGWSYRPYILPENAGKEKKPCICRVEPKQDGFTIEWFDAEDSGDHFLCFRPYGTDYEPQSLKCQKPVITVCDLEAGKDYEFWMERSDKSVKSEIRRVCCISAPGITVNYLHPKDPIYAFSGQYLCSPSLVKLREDTYLASMDVYAFNAPQNLSLLFMTKDGGTTWNYVCDLFPCFWGKLFVHKDTLYMLATTTEYGNLVIGCSRDDGQTWSAPVTLLTGAGSNTHRGIHKAPMPVVEYDGRLYTAIEYGSWATGGHAMGIVSIDADSDLMVAKNWQCTDFLPYNPTWPGAERNSPKGSVEGNVVISPEGEILNIMRYNTSGTPGKGKALVLTADVGNPEAALQFKKIIPFNGANSKFELQRDPVTGTYWAIVNEVIYNRAASARNVLSLAFSEDLEHFEIVLRILDYRNQNMDFVGFQYPSFLIDGDDICLLSRTAYGGAANFHDANQITFHRIRNFRQYGKNYGQANEGR